MKTTTTHPGLRVPAASAGSALRLVHFGRIAVPSLLATAMFAVIWGAPTHLAAQGTWSTAAPLLTPRTGHAMAADPAANAIYVAGGISFSPTCSFLATAEVYHSSTNTWSPLPAMAVPRAGTAGAVLNGLFYVAGGHATCGTAQNTMEAYNPATNSWTPRAPMAVTRSNFGFVAAGWKLYAIGGSNDQVRHTLVQAYDPAADSWTTKASLPVPSDAFATGVVGNVIYVAGGNGGTLVPTVFAYDTVADTWTAKASMATARSWVHGAVVNGIFHVIGGYDSNGPTTTVQSYHRLTDTWSLAASMPTARGEARCAALGGQIYVVGGWSGGGNHAALAVNEVFTPPPVAADTTPPVVHAISATPNMIWPPNKQMVTVEVAVSVSDNSGSPVTSQIIAVSGNELLGQNDVALTGGLTLKLRADRSGSASSRVYTITVRCTDAAGNATDDSVTVTVPHDQR